jgi:hypothetical protein
MSNKVNHIVKLCLDLLINGHDFSSIPNAEAELIHPVD